MKAYSRVTCILRIARTRSLHGWGGDDLRRQKRKRSDFEEIEHCDGGVKEGLFGRTRLSCLDIRTCEWEVSG